MDPLLSIFPPSLARLILCGGGGLPVTYGPLRPADGADGPLFVLSHGDPRGPVAMSPCRHPFMPLEVPEVWRLPLDHWRARLAMVAAWMLGDGDALFAEVCAEAGGGILLTIYRGSSKAPQRYLWGQNGQANQWTVPHLTFGINHDPAVALILALYDVPEIRARVWRRCDWPAEGRPDDRPPLHPLPLCFAPIVSRCKGSRPHRTRVLDSGGLWTAPHPRHR